VLGFIDVAGQPMTAAIEPDLMQTRALTVPGSWAASLRGSFGENALEGSRFAAENWGPKVSEQAVTETTANLLDQVTALKATGAKMLVLSLTPPQTAAAVGIAAQLGWSCSPRRSRRGAPTSTASASCATATTSASPRRGGHAEHRARLHRRDGVRRRARKGLRQRDLTRDGVLRAFHDTNGLSTGSLTGELRFSLVGRPSATQSYLSRPDARTPGTLKVVEGLHESELVKLKGTRAR